MSDEAENAATQKVVEQFRTSKEAKARLEGEMSALGEKLSAFAKALARPGEYLFRVDGGGVTVGQPIEEGRTPLRRPVARLEPSDMDWQWLTETLTNYNKACVDKRDSAARLRQMGLDIAE